MTRVSNVSSKFFDLAEPGRTSSTQRLVKTLWMRHREAESSCGSQDWHTSRNCNGEEPTSGSLSKARRQRKEGAAFTRWAGKQLGRGVAPLSMSASSTKACCPCVDLVDVPGESEHGSGAVADLFRRRQTGSIAEWSSNNTQRNLRNRVNAWLSCPFNEPLVCEVRVSDV